MTHIFSALRPRSKMILETLRFSLKIWKDFGFSEIHPYLATRPPKVLEGRRTDKGQESLKNALSREGLHTRWTRAAAHFTAPR